MAYTQGLACVCYQDGYTYPYHTGPVTGRGSVIVTAAPEGQ